MSSYIGGVADAVAAVLNGAQGSGGELSQAFEARRVFVPERNYVDIAAADGVLCHIFARAAERDRESRSTVRKEIEVSIIYTRKITQSADLAKPVANPEVDALVQLGEEISDLLAETRPITADKCPIVRIEQDPVYDFEALRTHRVFVALIRVFVRRW